MHWKTAELMDEKLRFIHLARSGRFTITELCQKMQGVSSYLGPLFTLNIITWTSLITGSKSLMCMHQLNFVALTPREEEKNKTTP